MNPETQLKLQAWLDGELPPAEAPAMARLAESDRDAAALVAELRRTTAALANNELARPLPESREFFWSKVERGILAGRGLPSGRSRPLWLSWWFRFLAPAGIVAALAIVLFTPIFGVHRGAHLAALEEIESPLDDVSVFTFRSETERMTVVWVNFQ
jgi:anti-sigma-K factor RskA